MAEEFVKTGLMDGMGESDEIKRRITVKGNHVPIKKGQTPKQAIEQAFVSRRVNFPSVIILKTWALYS